MKLIQNPSTRKKLVKRFFFFNSGSHLVQQSRTVLAFLVDGDPSNIPVKLFKIGLPVNEEKVFLALTAMLFSGMEQ